MNIKDVELFKELVKDEDFKKFLGFFVVVREVMNDLYEFGWILGLFVGF